MSIRGFDAVYLSTDDNFNPQQDRRLDYRQRFGRLAAGEFETRTVNFQLPEDIVGGGYLYVVSNVNRGVFETDYENNRKETAVNIMDDRPDLTVTGFAPRLGSGTLLPGQSFSFDYELHQSRPRTIATDRWTDRLLLSSDTTRGTETMLFWPRSIAMNPSSRRRSIALPEPQCDAADEYRLPVVGTSSWQTDGGKRSLNATSRTIFLPWRPPPFSPSRAKFDRRAAAESNRSKCRRADGHPIR